MTLSTSRNKVAGTIFLLCGILCILYLLYPQRLVLDNYSFFLTRYSKVIMVSYVGLGFVLFGISYLFGLLVPNFKANKYEKAKSNIFSSLLGIPFFLFLLILSSVSPWSNEIRKYGILGIVFSSIMIFYCAWSFVSNLNRFKQFHRKKNKT